MGLMAIGASGTVYADHHGAHNGAQLSPQMSLETSPEVPVKAVIPQVFTKKRYTIKGGWTIATVDGQTVITFDETFKTKGGPDLKVFLSRDELGGLSGQTALSNSERLGVLKTNKGAQSYIIPEDIDMTEFKSVIIHCEAFSVLWGGFNLP